VFTTICTYREVRLRFLFKAAQITQVANLQKPLDSMKIELEFSLVKMYGSECRHRPRFGKQVQ